METYGPDAATKGDSVGEGAAADADGASEDVEERAEALEGGATETMLDGFGTGEAAAAGLVLREASAHAATRGVASKHAAGRIHVLRQKPMGQV